jgi:low affinity Fe/Cu permease
VIVAQLSAPLDWHAIATLATVLMTFFIQRAAHRDIQALHAKIDVLLRVIRLRNFVKRMLMKD